MKKSIVILLQCCFLIGIAHATPTEKDLAKIEAEIKQAKEQQAENQRKSKAMDQEVKTVQKEMVNLANKVRKHEDQLSLLEQKKKELEKRQKELESNLSLSSKQMAKLMQAMQTLALRPREILLTQAATPIQMLRSYRLIQYSVPIVGGLKQTTLEDLNQLSQVKFELQSKIASIKTTTAELADKNEQMEKLAQQKKILQAQYASNYEKSKAKAEKLAKEASDLKELLANIQKEQQQKQAASIIQVSGKGAFAKAKGSLAWPAQGKITQNFGDTTGASQSHAKGMIITTRKGAQVTAPFDGTVLFAGPFQNYGQLVIIDHGDNYLTVLSGMDTITTTLGSQLLTGEPVGHMSTDYVNLYLEVRQNGQAINPRPWFI